MKTSMEAHFNILKNAGNGVYVTVGEDEIEYLSVGSLRFHIDKLNVPFDWNACAIGWDENGFINYTSGRGWFFNDFELDTCYDEYYAEIGLLREDISAEYLASTNHIEDFYLNFVCHGEELETGYYESNADNTAPYKLELLRVCFEDVDSGKLYYVAPEVIASFNKGEKGVSLESIIASAEARSNDIFCAANQSKDTVDYIGK